MDQQEINMKNEQVESDLIQRLTEDNMFGTATVKEIRALCRAIREAKKTLNTLCHKGPDADTVVLMAFVSLKKIEDILK